MLGQRGFGRAPSDRAALRLAARDFFGMPPSTVTKLGQKPFDARIVLVAGRLVDRALAAEFGFHRQDRMQFDCTPQSPQPSHTASLMNTRCVAFGYSPFLRRRRFSAAQVWS